MTEMSKKEKREKAKKNLKDAEQALEIAEQELALDKELHQLVLDNYTPTKNELDGADFEFRKLDRFYEINKAKQALKYAHEERKSAKRIEDLKEIIAEQKEIIKENRG